MAMRVETVDILVEKAHFEPHVAVAIAQAMDVAMEEKMYDRQLVTVSVLGEAKGELVMKIERLGGELRAELEITATAIRAELESTATSIRAEMASMGAQIRAEMASMGAQIRSELESTATSIRAELVSTAAQIRAELKAEIQASAAATKSDLLRHMYTAMATQLALLLGVSYFFVLHVR